MTPDSSDYDPEVGRSASEGPDSARRSVIGRLIRVPPPVWLFLMVLVYATVAFYLAELRALELRATTWDLGIYQQALWSAGHNGSFFEAPDLQTGGFHSLLEVHGVFLLYLVAPFYRWAPSATTLFMLQSAIVAVAAIPLYALARRLTQSSWLALISAAAYLAWTPTLSSTLYDFHAEAFLPVSLFALAALWAAHHYRWAFLAAAVTWSTFEIGAVLTFFLALFYLWPGSPLPRPGGAEPSPRPVPESGVGKIRSLLGSLARVWQVSARQYALLLLVGSVVAYFGLLVMRMRLLEPLLGLPPFPNSPSGYVIGSTPGQLQLGLANFGSEIQQKVAYWLLVYALVGFVPLLVRRSLLLTLPWFVFTLFSVNVNYAEMGWQYGLVLAGPMFVGFAYGLTRVRPAARAIRTRLRLRLPGRERNQPPRSKRPWGSIAGPLLFVGLLTVNLMLSPLNPALQNNPNLGAGYHVTYNPPPGFEAVKRVAALIPPNALVLASDDLFPFVTGDPNAFSLSWMVDPNLWFPFNSTNLPPYALLSSSREYATPLWLVSALGNPATYGLLGVVRSTGTGTVTLYEAGYAGPPAVDIAAFP